ncbi:MAG: hypothetical protein ACYSU7_04810 [Planctomycetota bacterium]|jgi:hypothetical protein
MRIAATLLFALSAGGQVWAGPDTVTVDLTADATIHSVGVELQITGDDNQNATVGLEYKESADLAWKAGHPLVRIDAVTFVGSAFFLEPDTDYDMRATVTDPDGAAPGQLTTLVRTRPDRGRYRRWAT